ncbi:MAG: 3-dehydroquinate synthase [Gammaproteobacteria bacterium]|nr:MAG: 3-dehydroquinate synthase [Gammaproteobacteria bacterium]
MKTLTVDLGNRSYPIHIGQHLLTQVALLQPHIVSKQVLIVSNDTVAPLYLDTLLSTLSAYDCYTVVLKDGEQYKSLDTLNEIFDAALNNKLNRQLTMIALGGGVIGDMAGFAASCYQRGVNFIQIPTTLLAQVDSSVGGKTAVNHPLGKNMIGAFYQPRCVLADISTLDTLPARELSAGLAEVIKYGVIRDVAFFEWLEQNMDALLARNSEVLGYAIERSCRNKAEIVEQDEHERGMRALLNLGHTFGHAIETACGYGVWLHGEAVAAGMSMAAELSYRLGWLPANDMQRIIGLIARAKLPVKPPATMSAAQFMDLMAVDKKVEDGKVRFVLLKALGDAVTTADFDAAIFEQFLNESCGA